VRGNAGGNFTGHDRRDENEGDRQCTPVAGKPMVVVIVHTKSLVAGALVAFLLIVARGHGAGDQPLLLEGTVVTMVATHHVLPRGRVLVRGGLIDAVDLRDHPSYDVLPLWLPPRKYESRYQWNLAPPPSYERLVQAPHTASAGLQRDVLAHREAQAALAGETAIEGVGSLTAAPVLIREIEGSNFGRADIVLRCSPDRRTGSRTSSDARAIHSPGSPLAGTGRDAVAFAAELRPA
jgi:hypothetical protein